MKKLYLILLQLLSVLVIQTKNESSVLIEAAKYNDYKTVKMLLKDPSFDINALDSGHKTALDYALEHGHIKIAFMLAKKGGKVTSLDNKYYLKKLFNQKAYNLIKGFGIGLLLGIALGVFNVPLVMGAAMSTCSGDFTLYNIILLSIAVEIVGALYVLSLPAQSIIYDIKSRSNWMLDFHEIN